MSDPDVTDVVVARIRLTAVGGHAHVRVRYGSTDLMFWDTSWAAALEMAATELSARESSRSQAVRRLTTSTVAAAEIAPFPHGALDFQVRCTSGGQLVAAAARDSVVVSRADSLSGLCSALSSAYEQRAVPVLRPGPAARTQVRASVERAR